jgi:hypothetical protein
MSFTLLSVFALVNKREVAIVDRFGNFIHSKCFTF